MGDKYKLVGTKNRGEKVDRVVLEGTSTNPEKYLDLNGPAVELDEETVKALKDRGLKLRKEGDTSESEQDEREQNEQQQAQAASSGAPASVTTPSTKPKS